MRSIGLTNSPLYIACACLRGRFKSSIRTFVYPLDCLLDFFCCLLNSTQKSSASMRAHIRVGY